MMKPKAKPLTNSPKPKVNPFKAMDKTAEGTGPSTTKDYFVRTPKSVNNSKSKKKK